LILYDISPQLYNTLIVEYSNSIQMHGESLQNQPFTDTFDS